MNNHEHEDEADLDEQPTANDTPTETTETTANDPLEELFAIDNEADEDEADLDEPEPIDTTDPAAETEATKTESVPEDFIEDVVFMLDDMKAQICQAIAGDPTPDKYRNTSAKRKNFAAQTSRFLESKDFKITPNQAYLLAVLMFVAPSFAGALYARNKRARAKPTPTPETPDQQPPITDATPHEAMSRRTRFETHATTGAYKYTATGEYINVTDATEYPSETVKELIKRNFTATEIKKYLGY